MVLMKCNVVNKIQINFGSYWKFSSDHSNILGYCRYGITNCHGGVVI